MKFQGAVVKEQGVVFGILIVKAHILSSPTSREEMNRFGKRAFGQMPIILMSQDSRGVPKYYGRTDIVNFLAKVPMSCIPWKEYTVA